MDRTAVGNRAPYSAASRVNGGSGFLLRHAVGLHNWVPSRFISTRRARSLRVSGLGSRGRRSAGIAQSQPRDALAGGDGRGLWPHPQRPLSHFFTLLRFLELFTLPLSHFPAFPLSRFSIVLVSLHFPTFPLYRFPIFPFSHFPLPQQNHL